MAGIYCIRQQAAPGRERTRGSAREAVNIGVKAPYLRALSIELDPSGLQGLGSASGTLGGASAAFGGSRRALLSGSAALGNASKREQELMHRIASRPYIYDLIVRSIAPSIYGSEDVKKAIACLLFGGSRKRHAHYLYCAYTT